MHNKISLLYKNADKKLHVKREMPEFMKDLQFNRILGIMCADSKNQNSKWVITSVLAELCEEPEDIDFRYDILQDFQQVSQLLPDLQLLFAQLDPVEKDRQESRRVRNRVSAEYKLAMDIGIFLEYCEIYKKLAGTLSCHRKEYMSEGVGRLAALVCDYATGDSFNELKRILWRLKQCLKGYMRLKLEVRMDTSFKLTKAVVLDIDSNGFGADSLDKEEYTANFLTQGLKKLFTIGNKYGDAYIIKQMDYILEQNVNEIKDKVLTSISSILEDMASSISSFLTNLCEEILFYQGAFRLVKVMHNLGLATVKAVLAPASERGLQVQGLYDLSFALYLADTGCEKPLDVIVPNNVFMEDWSRIQVITGPNQGGKTTYIRAMGILQVLAQAGIPVPADKVVVSPVDHIFTHFPADEKPESNEGRLGEELDRMLCILENATPRSLVLMNESFASTNSKEGSWIAEDILSALAVIGARCAFVTHLYELAERVGTINNEIQRRKEGSSRLISMVAQFEEDSMDTSGETQENIRKRTYRILPGSPAKSTFATDIAEQFGIRYRDRIIAPKK